MISVAESLIKKFKRLSSREPRLPNDSLFFVMRKLTTYDFIERAKKIHGDKYDYSLVDYKKAHDKVKIICKEHGVFTQIPSNHLRGKGCHDCGGTVSLTKEVFIERSNNIHDNKYEYDFVDYKNNSTKVKIRCKIHGYFLQTPSKHLQGRGCQFCGANNCSNSKLSNTYQFIKRAINKHGHRYNYEFVNYKTSKTKVKIICKKHGIFSQTPDKHLCGSGCYYCGLELLSKHQKDNPTSWSVTNWEKASLKSKFFDSFKVYVIKCWNDNETFYKVGRTFLKTNRRFQSKFEMPYNYEVVKELIFDNARDCFNKELELKRLNSKNKYIPSIGFGGMYECFSKII